MPLGNKLLKIINNLGCDFDLCFWKLFCTAYNHVGALFLSVVEVVHISEVENVFNAHVSEMSHPTQPPNPSPLPVPEVGGGGGGILLTRALVLW